MTIPMEPLEEDVARELLDVSRGDPGRARMLRESLRRLADHGEQPELREMARDVLAGRTTLRAAMQAQAYRGPLGEQVTKFLDWYRNLSPEERTRQEAAGRQQLDRLRAIEKADHTEPKFPINRAGPGTFGS
jgi:hypothetical protein